MTRTLLITCLAFLACKKNDAEVIEKHRPEASKQLERLKKVAALLKAQPPLDADAATLDLGSTSFQRYAKPSGDGAFVDAEMMNDAGLNKDFFDTWISIEQHPFWSRCGAWLTTGKNPDGSDPKFANVIEEELQGFMKVKKLAVVRTVQLVVPEPTGTNQFSGGRYRFDVFFYELADAPKYLGGVRVDAFNDENVKVKFKQSSKNADLKDWLVHNLRFRSQAALVDAVTARAPGVKMDGADFYKPD